jgi:hypothetical protein
MLFSRSRFSSLPTFPCASIAMIKAMAAAMKAMISIQSSPARFGDPDQPSSFSSASIDAFASL